MMKHKELITKWIASDDDMWFRLECKPTRDAYGIYNTCIYGIDQIISSAAVHQRGFYKMLDNPQLLERMDRLVWENVSRYQNMNLEFVKKHFEKLDLYWLKRNEKIGEDVKDFISQMGDLL